jgi:hypothetical protein
MLLCRRVAPLGPQAPFTCACGALGYAPISTARHQPVPSRLRPSWEHTRSKLAKSLVRSDVKRQPPMPTHQPFRVGTTAFVPGHGQRPLKASIHVTSVARVTSWMSLCPPSHWRRRPSLKRCRRHDRRPSDRCRGSGIGAELVQGHTRAPVLGACVRDPRQRSPQRRVTIGLAPGRGRSLVDPERGTGSGVAPHVDVARWLQRHPLGELPTPVTVSPPAPAAVSPRSALGLRKAPRSHRRGQHGPGGVRARRHESGGSKTDPGDQVSHGPRARPAGVPAAALSRVSRRGLGGEVVHPPAGSGCQAMRWACPISETPAPALVFACPIGRRGGSAALWHRASAATSLELNIPIAWPRRPVPQSSRSRCALPPIRGGLANRGRGRLALALGPAF